MLERIKTTLQDRVDSKTLNTARIRARRIRLVTSAMAWLEKIGYDQGDLRPPSSLLMADENIRTVRELEEYEDETNRLPLADFKYFSSCDFGNGQTHPMSPCLNQFVSRIGEVVLG